MKHIILRRTATEWTAQFVDNAEVLALFGTDTIPTAYGAQTSASAVLNAVAQLNPCCVVSLATL